MEEGGGTAASCKTLPCEYGVGVVDVVGVVGEVGRNGQVCVFQSWAGYRPPISIAALAPIRTDATPPAYVILSSCICAPPVRILCNTYIQY